MFHLSGADWTQKSVLKDKLSWVIRAGLEDLDDPDYMIGGERCAPIQRTILELLPLSVCLSVCLCLTLRRTIVSTTMSTATRLIRTTP